MPFNSIGFSFFFPGTLLLFFLTPSKMRGAFLVLASYFFYSFVSIDACVLLLLISLISYGGAFILQKYETDSVTQRRWLVALVGLHVLVLCFFKYFNFVFSQLVGFSDSVKAGHPFVIFILMPLGLSYYIFQSIGYLVDIYWGKEKEPNLVTFLLFMSFFPKMLMGPIERGEQLLPQLRRINAFRFDYDNLRHGLLLFLWGFFKKVVVADRLALYVNQIYQAPGEYSRLAVLIAVTLFAFQLYADFSGYTDMALGTAKLFNIDLVNNFARPFYAVNIQEFWRRWHISLSAWMGTYVFTPLRMVWRNAGSVGLASAILVTFVLVGVWHGTGWTYALFGLLHATCMWVSTVTWKNREAFWKSKNQNQKLWLLLARRLSTFAFVCFAFIFFRANSLGHGFEIIRAVLNSGANSPVPGNVGAAALAILVMEVGEWLIQHRAAIPRLMEQPIWIRWPAYATVMLVVLCFGMFSNPRSFIYFDF
jgi:alginate O-acetyltransferase complex protein AlgI